MNIHQLKCESKYFKPLYQGLKSFEIRYNDRDYKVGDVTIICELDSFDNSQYTGRFLVMEILYLTDYMQIGSMVVLSLKEIFPVPESMRKL